jgi:hypothetical protein
MKSRYHIILIGALALVAASCDRQKPASSASPAAAEESTTLNYHALVIGVDDYSGTGWPNLNTPRADAEAMGAVLQSNFGFEVTQLLGSQASRGNILRELDQLKDLNPHDALLIYFAGHGYYDKKMDEGYWIPHGAERSRMGHPAKEDWLWNSSISRILSASPARHILVVADTCYGGSLFRGIEVTDKSMHWYERAMEVPSRYLITSGNLEPVLDSGIRHSVFAQEVLNYLQYTEQDVFSASDIAVSIRTKVSQLTGQLVRMGPLASPAHAGGEFVFVRTEASLPKPEPESAAPEKTVYRTSGLDDRMVQLAKRVESFSRDTFVRPRILACLGPSGPNPEETAMVRNRLHASLNSVGGSILVERAAFDTLLQEMELGRSGMADQRVAMEIGKLLPASLILFGEIIPVGQEKEIHLRIVDTETSRVLSSDSARFSDHTDLGPACQALAERTMKTMNEARPLLLPAHIENGLLEAEWGRFHGARIGDMFNVITREGIDTIAPQETVIGTARLQQLGEEQSGFEVEWNQPQATPPATFWLKAVL